MIGGGIKDAALSYELQKLGLAVLMLEEYTTPENATHYSAGVAVCAGLLSRQLLQSSGIDKQVYFIYAEIIEPISTDIQLRTLVMPAPLPKNAHSAPSF